MPGDEWIKHGHAAADGRGHEAGALGSDLKRGMTFGPFAALGAGSGVGTFVVAVDKGGQLDRARADKQHAEVHVLATP